MSTTFLNYFNVTGCQATEEEDVNRLLIEEVRKQHLLVENQSNKQPPSNKEFRSSYPKQATGQMLAT